MGTIREYLKEDGSISYHAEVRLRGHPSQRETFRTRSQAKKWIQDTESAIRDGRHFKTTEAKRHTVGELIDRFISQWLPKNPKGQAKQTALLTWWKNRLGHLVLADLTSNIIAESRDALLAENTVRKKLRSPSTVNRYLASLSRALSVAVKEWGWIDDTPMRKVSKPKEPPPRDRYLSIEEKSRFLSACQKSDNPFLYDLACLAILTGMRFSEAAKLKYEDIDFTHRSIMLRETKNGDHRVLPLTKTVEEVIKNSSSYKAGGTGMIFKSERSNNRKGVVSVRHAFQKVLAETNIKNFRWHDLRRTAGSYLAMAGATQGELMEILGHRSHAMTRVYAKFNQKHIRNVLEKTGEDLIAIKLNQEIESV